jgi:hypothetical protein
LIWWCSGVGLWRRTSRASRSSTVTVMIRIPYKVIILCQENGVTARDTVCDEPDLRREGQATR